MNEDARKPDEIMAEYLLGGAKMLAELCPTCRAPMFEVQGKHMCVVCAERPSGASTASSASASPVEKVVVAADGKNGLPDTLQVITPKYAAARMTTVPVSGEIHARFDALILQFCARAENEPDPARCLSYMECIRTAAEARTILNR
ncbi:MAG: hypothetical protein LBU24_04875 [Methanocalculaceae archaeon]|nr:hypothetical protein [Methanocalculaceae archaeon]